MALKAITVGSAMADSIVLVGDSDIERMTMQNATSSFLLLEQGRKIEALSITSHVGGGAVNAAVSLSRLGADTSTLIKIGCDANGGLIMDRLIAEKIGSDFVRQTDELPTGTAVMVSSHDKNATIFTQRGANTLMKSEDIAATKFDGHDLVYVTNLSNRSADCFPEIVKRGRDAGAFVAANPGIRQLTSRSSPFLDSLENVDLLAINREEAESLIPVTVGRFPELYIAPTSMKDCAPRLTGPGGDRSGLSVSLHAFCRAIRKLGTENVLITDGIHGSYLATSNGLYHCPIRHAEVLGTAGAGDGFISTASLFLASGRSVDDALKAATLNASSVVSHIDTQEGLLNALEIDQMLAHVGEELAVTTLS